MKQIKCEEGYWEQRAQHIYFSHHVSRAGRFILDSMLERIARLGNASKSSKILEIGCAAGTQSLGFKQKGFKNVFGVDINFNVLIMAKNNGIQQNVKENILIQGDGFMLPIKSETFDVVFSVGVMEHIENMEGCLLEQRRVLKKDGILVMAVPNRYCPWWYTVKKWRAKLSKKKVFAFPPCFRTFLPSEGIRQLENAGFLNIFYEAADFVFPQCPDWLSEFNVFLEKAISKTPVLKYTQAMLYFFGRR